jgi:hypothetical protein
MKGVILWDRHEQSGKFKYNWNDQVNKYEIGWACSMNGAKEKHVLIIGREFYEHTGDSNQ